MTRNPLTVEEKERRQLLLQDYGQWRESTGSNSRVAFVRERDIELGYLLNCLKWQYRECRKDAEKGNAAQTGAKPEGFPSLVAVTKAAPSAEGPAIRIRMRASSIELSGEITPVLLGHLLSTLGALNVL